MRSTKEEAQVRKNAPMCTFLLEAYSEGIRCAFCNRIFVRVQNMLYLYFVVREQ